MILNSKNARRRCPWWGAAAVALVCAYQSGCISHAANAVPAYRLQELAHLEGTTNKVPIDLAMLGQEAPQSISSVPETC